MSCLTDRRIMCSILYDWFKYILDGGGGQVYQYPKYYFYTTKYYKVLLLYIYFYISLKENWFISIHQNWLLIYTHPTVLYTYWMLMFQGRYYFEQMRQIQPKLKEGTKIDKAKIFVCTLYVCVTIRSSECPIMWFRIAENGSVKGDATASPFTMVSPLCHRSEFQHFESQSFTITPPTSNFLRDSPILRWFRTLF